MIQVIKETFEERIKKMKEKKKKSDQEQINNMVDEGGPSYSEQMQDELEPIYRDKEMDYSGAFESDVEES